MAYRPGVKVIEGFLLRRGREGSGREGGKTGKNVPSSPGRCAVIGCKLKQNANEGCNSCASLAGPRLVLSFIVSFIACLIVVVIPP